MRNRFTINKDHDNKDIKHYIEECLSELSGMSDRDMSIFELRFLRRFASPRGLEFLPECATQFVRITEEL